MDYIDMLQWPAMVVTVVAAWLVASISRRKRIVGFWVFIASNVLWSIWGWHSQAYALIVLQILLAAMNARGVYKNDPELKVTTGSPTSRASRPRRRGKN